MGLFLGGAAARKLLVPAPVEVPGINPRSDAWYDLRLTGDGLMDNQLL